MFIDEGTERPPLGSSFKFRQEHFYTGLNDAFLFSVDINPDKLNCAT